MVQIVTQYLEEIKIDEQIPIVNKEIKNYWVASRVTIGLAIKKFWKKINHISHALTEVDRKVSIAVFIVSLKEKAIHIMCH